MMRKLLSILMLAGIIATIGCSKKGAKEFTVTFDTQGGSVIKSQTVEEGKKVTEPTQPTKEDFVFAGWFKEATCNNEWNFDKDIVTNNITLYAKWGDKTFTVTFNTNGGSTIEPQKVAKGARVLKPTPPTKDGVAFGGWYKEATLTNEYDFETPVTNDITIHAKWTTVSFEALGELISEAENLDRNRYSNASYQNMQEKLDLAKQVFYNEYSTAEKIEAAYKALSEAIAALVENPYIPTTDIYISEESIDEYEYVISGGEIHVYAEGCDKSGRTSTNNGVIFEYDAIKSWIDKEAMSWTDGYADITDHSFTCYLKSDIQLGSTAKIIIKSAEFPSITKEVNYKVVSKEDLKKMFLDIVNSLPFADKITYDHYEILEKARILYNSLPYDIMENKDVIDAFNKLDECYNAYYNLPSRFFYSFNGKTCVFSQYEDGIGESIELAFVPSGPFPQGTYTAKDWWNDDDDIWYQDRLNLKDNNIFTSEIRCANNPEGNNPTEWNIDEEGTYKIEGNDKKGVLYLTWKEEDSSSPIKASKCTTKNGKAKKIRAFYAR